MRTSPEPVDVFEDQGWSGVWAKCPYCNQDNGVTWSGLKKCTQCNEEFFVAEGALVRKRPAKRSR